MIIFFVIFAIISFLGMFCDNEKAKTSFTVSFFVSCIAVVILAIFG